MGRILVCLTIAVLALGCRLKVPHAPDSSLANDSIKLPEAVSGKPIENAAENDVLLNINSSGEVIPPFDRLGDSRPLANISELEEYLRQRADTEKMELSKDKPDGVPILRIDRDAPFEKAYPILRACRLAGYEKYQLRVLRTTNPIETQIPLLLRPAPDVLDVPNVAENGKYVVRFDTADNGQITAITFRVDGDPEDAGECLGAELTAYETKLRTVATAEKNRTELAAMQGVKISPPQLTLELSDKLPHASAVKLLDIGLHVGFGDVLLVPLDPAKR